MNPATKQTTEHTHRIDEYSPALFREYVGQRFVFRVPESAAAVCGPELDLVLVEVREDERITRSVAASGKSARTPFSILLRADRESFLSSGLLRLRHPDFEEVPLFLSRVQMLPGDIAGDVAAPHFEAVFA